MESKLPASGPREFAEADDRSETPHPVGHLEAEDLLEAMLRSLVRSTGADVGYLELRPPANARPAWTAACAKTPGSAASIQKRAARSVDELLTSGRTLRASPGSSGECRREGETARRGNIGSVICAPIREGSPAGAIYLQRLGTEGFPRDAVEHVALMGRLLASIHDLLLDAADPTSSADAADPGGDWKRLGRSPAFVRSLEQLRPLAAYHVPILLTGQPGTGKRYLARAIHERSASREGPFVEVACDVGDARAVAERLFERMDGGPPAVRRAEGGTLYLHHVEALSREAWGRVLGMLRSSTGDAPRRVRLIASENAASADAARPGRWSRRLPLARYFAEVQVPPLSERQEDLATLATCFLRREARRLGRGSRAELAESARRAIEACGWPGNLHELEEILRTAAACAYAEGCDRIHARHLLRSHDDDPADVHLTYQEATHRFQRCYVEGVLERCDWNVSRAARHLGLARSHVYNLINAFGLELGFARERRCRPSA